MREKHNDTPLPSKSQLFLKRLLWQYWFRRSDCYLHSLDFSFWTVGSNALCWCCAVAVLVLLKTAAMAQLSTGRAINVERLNDELRNSTWPFRPVRLAYSSIVFFSVDFQLVIFIFPNSSPHRTAAQTIKLLCYRNRIELPTAIHRKIVLLERQQQRTSERTKKNGHYVNYQFQIGPWTVTCRNSPT